MSTRKTELAPLTPEQRLDVLDDCVKLLTQQSAELGRLYQSMPDEMAKAVTAAGVALLSDRQLISETVGRVLENKELVTKIIDTVKSLHLDQQDKEMGVRFRQITGQVKYKVWLLWIGGSALLVGGYVPDPLKRLFAWLSGRP